MRGLFITFEGCEGSGKSTIINLIYQRLNKLIENKEINYSCIIKTREPGGFDNKLAEKIRELVLSSEYDIPPLTEALLFAASRNTHIINTIEPILNKNGIVLSDRFVDSSIVYQGYVKNLGQDVQIINDIATNELKPDITFYLRLNPEIGLERINQNKRITNRFDNEDFLFHKKVSDYYDKHLIQKDNVIVVDASQTIGKVTQFCIDKILLFKK